MKRSTVIKILFFTSYFVVLVVSWWTGFNPGQEIGRNFISFSATMLGIIPGAFILIGLFEVWVKRETVERHLFPVAYALYSKGAKLSVIFTYLGAAAVCRIPMAIFCRIPMAIFEASFLGIKFTVIRWLVSLPLVIITSILLGNYLTRKGYKVSAGK